MMSGFYAIYLREMRILRRRIKRQMAGMAVSPLLYMVTFGYALGHSLSVGGRSYLEFLVPGLVAMASMTQAFSIATDINVSRFYLGIFEEFQAAPLSRPAYVLGEICAGLSKALISIGIILVLGLIAGVRLHYGPWFWLAIFLNGFSFAALAVAMAMLVKSHADQGVLSNFIITPMSFLGGTFFPLDTLPGWAKTVLGFLPLSHASGIIRADAFGQPVALSSFAVLIIMGAASLGLAVYSVAKSRD
jgi:ABC-type multidrug transport system permease subunit